VLLVVAEVEVEVVVVDSSAGDGVTDSASSVELLVLELSAAELDGVAVSTCSVVVRISVTLVVNVVAAGA
jgi:hypothetical protein